MSLVFDINNKRMKIVLIKSRGGRFILEKFLKIDLPENMVENGYLIDSSFSILIKKVLKDNNIKEKKCIIVISSTEILSREITVPIINKKKLDLLVLNEIESYLGKVVHHIRDFCIIGKTFDSNDEKKLDDTLTKSNNRRDKKNGLYNVMVYSTPEKLVLSWYKALEDAGLKPYKMDTEQNCIGKIYFNNKINNTNIEDKSVISVYLEDNRVVLNLILYGKNSFSRVIDFNETMFNEYQSYGIQEQNLDISKSQMSENIDLYNKISGEVIKLMQFSLSQKIRKPVSSVYLFGNLSEHKEIVMHLEESLSTTVEVIELLSTINIKGSKAQVDTAEVILSAGSVMGWNL